jgi:uncharacterized protein YlxP (DUF503 family)
MFVGYGWITLRLSGVRSLKDKRHLIRPLLEDLRRRFKVSAAEVDFMDAYDRSRVGFAGVGASPSDVRDFLENMVRLLELTPGLNIVESQVDVL